MKRIWDLACNDSGFRPLKNCVQQEGRLHRLIRILHSEGLVANVDDESFELMIGPFTGIIAKICRAYADTQPDIDDYFQEVCLQIWRSRNSFSGQSDRSTWVYRLTLNVCLTLLRNDKRKKAKSKPMLEDFQANRPAETLATDENLQRLYAAIRQLSGFDRAVILLHLEQKSNSDIASIVGSNANNIGVRISRIRKRLRQIVESA